MKKLIITALCSLVVLGLGAHQAFAFGCCKHNYRCCAAQYNAFSPFCCNTVMTKHFCKKCFHVMECPQPYCPPTCAPSWCTVDGGECHGNPAAAAMWMGGEQLPAGYQVLTPMPVSANAGMTSMPYGMPNAMIHMAGYQPYPQSYGYPQNYAYPQMLQGHGAMMQNGVVPMNNVPWYWNGQVPTNGQ